MLYGIYRGRSVQSEGEESNYCEKNYTNVCPVCDN